MSYLELEDSFTYKIIVFGESNSGKTAFTDALKGRPFREKIPKTIGVNLIKKRMFHDNIPLTLLFWDFSGELRFQSLFSLYTKGTNAGIFMFDMSDLDTLYKFKKWIKIINNSPFPIIVVGNKFDLVDATESKIIELILNEVVTGANVVDYLICSCKHNIGIDVILDNITLKLVN